MSIKDLHGREFIIHCNTSNLMRVRDEAGIDLLRVLEKKDTLADLLADMEKQMKVFYVMCKNQVTDKNITWEQWVDAWNGDLLEVALEELMESLAKYFPKSKGAALRQGVAALKEFVGKLYEKAGELSNTETVDKVVETLVDKAKRESDEELRKLGTTPLPESGKLAGSSSETALPSSASTPAPTLPTNLSL